MSDTHLIYKVALTGTKSTIRTLGIICSEHPRKLLTTEIAKQAKLHRGTVCVSVKELTDLGLIEQTIKPKTEKKRNPTYLYTISQDVDKDELSKILGIKTKSSSKSFEEQVSIVLIRITEEIISLQNQVEELEKREIGN